MARLEAPVTNTRRVAPAARASSTAYWMSGLSTTGSISFGLALVAGRKRVPRPSTGKTAVRITDFGVILIASLPRITPGTPPSVSCKWVPQASPSSCSQAACRRSRKGSLLALFGPLEDRRAHAVPRAAFRAAPIPADAEQAAVIALVTPAGVPDSRQQRPEGPGIRRRL